MSKIEWIIHRLYTIPRCHIGWHRKDAVYFNEYNGVTQCQCCGAVTDWHGLTPKQALDLAKRG